MFEGEEANNPEPTSGFAPHTIGPTPTAEDLDAVAAEQAIAEATSAPAVETAAVVEEPKAEAPPEPHPSTKAGPSVDETHPAPVAEVAAVPAAPEATPTVAATAPTPPETVVPTPEVKTRLTVVADDLHVRFLSERGYAIETAAEAQKLIDESSDVQLESYAQDFAAWSTEVPKDVAVGPRGTHVPLDAISEEEKKSARAIEQRASVNSITDAVDSIGNVQGQYDDNGNLVEAHHQHFGPRGTGAPKDTFRQ